MTAVLVTVAAWNGAPPDLSADDARAAARQQLEDAAVLVVRVGQDVRKDTYEGRAVWRVPVEVSGGEIQLYLARSDGAPVYLDDLGRDGRRLLTDGQYARLREVAHNPLRDTWVDRNVQITVAAIVLLLVAIAFALVPIGTPTHTGAQP